VKEEKHESHSRQQGAVALPVGTPQQQRRSAHPGSQAQKATGKDQAGTSEGIRSTMSMDMLNNFWVLEGFLISVIAIGLISMLFDKDKD
jgi:hypothetical protein